MCKGWCASRCQVLLKPVDAVIAGVSSQCNGRWTKASSVSEMQLWDYWSRQEAAGFVHHDSLAQDLACLACRTHKESKGSREYKRMVKRGRLGGVLLATTSSGLVLHLQGFVGSETLPIRYFFIGDLKSQIPELQAIIHDDSCHVYRYALKHAERSDLAKSVSEMTFALDRFHSSGHTDPWCREHCGIEKHKELLDGYNTSAAETANSTLSRYKCAVRCMGSRTRIFFLSEITDSRNRLAVRR